MTTITTEQAFKHVMDQLAAICLDKGLSLGDCLWMHRLDESGYVRRRNAVHVLTSWNSLEELETLAKEATERITKEE